MDLNPTTTTPTPTPDTDTETPPQTQPSFKSLSFTTNGSLKRHQDPHLPPPPPPPQQPQPQPPMLVSYKECLKNHAAAMGGLALDGCGEFLSSPTATPSDPSSLKCAACGCHRNFHRRDSPKVHNFHHQNLNLSSPSSSTSPSPSPVRSPPPLSHLPPSQYYYTSSSSIPQMLLSLSAASPQPSDEMMMMMMKAEKENPLGRKRFRTKFTQEQKEKMFLFSEKLGWRMQKCSDSLVDEFCKEIGIDRKVLRVWMHNNKNNTLKKREEGLVGHDSIVNVAAAAARISFETNAYCCKKEIDYNVNGSSSSS